MRIPFFPGRTRAATAAPLRRLRLPAACSGQRPHPGGDGRRRSTARLDCRSRVVPVRRRARLRRARGRDARAPGATLRCALSQGEVFGEPRRACAVRAPPARTRAGRPRTRRNPQVRAFAWGGFWGAPACLRGAHAGGTPAHPAQPSGARALAGAGWLASPGMPSPVSGIRTPPIPLLTLWEQRVGG
jgi:hypothetical protein